MSRIRSVHPGLATDELYMAMSLACKAAWPLLWTECDDNGAFEWKPLVLKARIFPAENLDFSAILSELKKLGCIKSYEHDGRMFGIVRNFTKFQRPKKPQSRYFIPDELRTFAGLTIAKTEPVPNRLPTKSELSPQMEDEGGKRRREDGERKKDAATSAAPDDAERDLFRRGKAILGQSSGGLIKQLLKAKKSTASARAAIETASTKEDPREFIAGCIRGDPAMQDARTRGDAW